MAVKIEEEDSPTRSGRIGESSTDISLREYIEARLKSERQLTTQMFESLKEATDKVATNLTDRFASVNEFRSVLTDQQKSLITRTEFDSKSASQDERIGINTEQINELRRGASNLQGRITTIGAGFAMVVIVIQIALHFLPK